MQNVKRIIIMVIIAIMLMMIIATLTNKVSAAPSYIGQTLSLSGGDTISNKNYYCIQHGKYFNGGTYTVKAIAKIVGNSATAETSSGTVNPTWNDARANYIMNHIFNQAEDYEYDTYRSRTGYNFYNDEYQWAVWHYMKTWSSDVFGGTEINNYVSEWNTHGGQAVGYMTRGKNIVSDISDSSWGASNSTESVSISNNTGTSTIKTKEVIDDYSILGPFRYSYSGSVSSYSISLDNPSGTLSKSYYSIVTYSGTSLSTKSTIPNGQDFYIKARTDKIQNAKKLTINISAQVSTSGMSSTIYFLTSGNNQNLIYVETGYDSIETTGSRSDTFTLDQQRQLTIQKQDASGNNLKVSGIKFEVYNSSGTKVGTLTTDANGKTGVLNVLPNVQYTIKETANSAYGYKGCFISDAKITSGQGTISTSNNTITIKLTQNSTISVKNKPQLGQLVINKKGADGNALEGVEFVIYKGDKYLKLDDASVTTPITTSDTGLDMSGATTVSTADAATKFKTNSSGKIVLNNLEIYSSSSAKYEYWVYERSNENYGYNDPTLGEITVTGGTELDRPTGYEDWAHFDITSSTSVTINNIRQLANIEIVKVGRDDKKLQGVEFIVEIGSGKYLQLKNSSGTVVTPITGEATINIKNVANSSEYSVEYVADKKIATTFITDSNGKITINNVEVNKENNSPYSYTAHETYNPNYGYGAANGASINGKITSLTKNQTTTIKISNNLNVGTLEIVKVDKDNEAIKLPNVEFKIEISSGTTFKKYLAIYNQSGLIPAITGELITINLDNIATSQEYRVGYVDDQNNATTFITNESGKIAIKNLEANKSATETYSYTAYEIRNPNYGYGDGSNVALTGKVTKLTLDQTNSVTVKNNQELGNIAIDALGKHDKDYTNIKLSDVEFVLKIKSKTKTAFIALYDANGNFKSSIKDTATINSKNVANSTEYRVEYVTSQNQATKFLTGDKGQLKISNLEKYELHTGNEYKYDLIEVSNPHYGYDSNVTISDITINKGQTTEVTVANKQVMIKLSGYVWVEHSPGKGSGYDGVYNVSTDTPDKKLTDLYIMVNGKLAVNTNAQVPVEIKLRDRNTGKYIKTLPDSFDSNGKYTFEGVSIANLSDYEVVFIYDGYYYTTIATNLVADNGSKVKESEEERSILNNKFGVVKDNNEIVSTDGNDTNTVTYTKDVDSSIVGHESSVALLNFDETIVANTDTDGTNISATTYAAGYYLDKKLDELKKPRTTPIDVIDNVNMGIVLREQPKIQIGSDIYHVYVEVNGKEYTYEYDSRKDYYENVNGDEVGVKFEQENLKNRYTKTVYSSDVQSLVDGKTSMKVSVVYKIKLSNKSTTLTSSIREITNYYDKQAYESIAIGATIDEVKNNTQVSNYKVVSSSENINVQGAENAYNSARIKLGDLGIQLKAGENKDIYIKFNVSNAAIIKLLQGTSTYHNATEIMSYSTYYGAQTNQIIDAKTSQSKGYFTTDETKEGNIYAGVDRASQVGNIELKLIDYSSGDGTKVLDTTDFEDDTTSAPSFVLEASESRRISGIIWEDSSVVTEDKERFGDGKYDDTNEKPIADVTVELYHLGEDGTIGEIAKYSNDVPIRTTTDENGEYTLGYKDETGKYYGILPGKYVIKYTYNNESYIVNPTNGNQSLNVNDYKSTIITSSLMKETFKSEAITYTGTEIAKIENAINLRWYTTQEADRYSDAIDNIELRNSLDEESVIYSNYKDSIEPEYVMNAYTPVMDIGVEFTSEDSGIGYTLDERGEIKDIDPVRVEVLENIDFGIVERPNLDIAIDKNITGLEIIAQNGTNIIPYGNPSDLNSTMQYVKKLDDMVSLEIEADLLQGAKLSLEYTITLINKSETDYLGTEYYYYGNKNGATKREIIINKLVDYLDSDLIIDWEKTADSGTVWTEYTSRIDELSNAGEGKQYISPDVYAELQTKNYTVLMAEFNGEEIFEQQDEKVLNLYATKYLAVSDSIVETNSVEIIELSGVAGRRTIKGSVPGDYVPGNVPAQNDEDHVRMVITPPTGTTVNYTLYIIAAVATFAILISGIVIIKKKIIK